MSKLSNALTPIYLPTSLVEKAKKKLEGEREIELETFLSIYLRQICRAKTILRLDDEMPFGKYAGEVVNNIVRIDPKYVSWLVAQDGQTKFSPEVLALLHEIQEL